MADRAALIASIERTPAALRELTANASEAALDFRATSEDWTVREILAHLVDDELYVMRMRLERIVEEDHPHLKPHDEKHWHAHRNTARDALEQLLGDFEIQRAASLNLIAFLRESDWARTGLQPEYGTFTADEWLKMWADHDEVHLTQIAETLGASGRSSS